METLVLIDGHNLLFKMFFGMPSTIKNQNGKCIHAVLGFTSAVLKIIRALEANYILIVFDSEESSDRNLINPAYKQNRVDYSLVCEDENPFSQYPEIISVLKYLKLPFFEARGVEADDVICDYTGIKNLKKIIVSNDSDFLQLVNADTVLYKYNGDASMFFNEEKVKEKYLISPCFFADFKALCGDASDNVKGVPKVGKVTAAKLINEFGGVMDIIKNADNIKSQTLKEAIKEHQELILNNLKVVRLEAKDARPFLVEELAFNPIIKGLRATDILKTLKIF
ncbi:MAG: hypothetical protein FWE36_02440 [Erysipelotrichales bacterium]|nr:hypothetical protein [Erysipelotrichales bacterium]